MGAPRPQGIDGSGPSPVVFNPRCRQVPRWRRPAGVPASPASRRPASSCCRWSSEPAPVDRVAGTRSTSRAWATSPSPVGQGPAVLRPGLPGLLLHRLGLAHGEPPQAQLPSRFRPGLFFLQICDFSYYPRFNSFTEMPLFLTANNYLTMHPNKTCHICNMLRISSSFTISHFHPCLKCLNCCLH